MPPDISIVVPAFNEEQRLPATLTAILSYLGARGLTFELLVVDDGSADGTAAVARGFEPRGVRVLSQPVNRGKGAALKRGVLASSGRRVLLTDADLSTPIEDLERLEAHLDKAPLVIGSRALPDSDVSVHQPFYREWMGRTFNLILRGLGFGAFRDTQCGFKLLDGEVARRLFAELTVERFAYDVQLLLLARRHGLRVAEVGVRWANSPSSRVDPLRDSAQMLWDVVQLRLRHLSRR